MTRKLVQQLADGDAVDDVFLVSDKQVRSNRNGNPYLQVDLRDRSGVINARLWNVGEPLARSFEAGDFVRARGKVQLFQGSFQIILTHIERVEPAEVDLPDFMPHADQDLGVLWAKLRDFLNRIEDPHGRALIQAFLMDEAFVRDFMHCPAGVRNHHAYIGGLLDHVLTLMEGADRLVRLYPEVNRDLVLLGVFLHDCGKARELTYRRSFSYTDVGQLLGHICIGVELVTEKIVQAEQLLGESFPAEWVWRVKHMILSHHGQLDFGSPVLPMTPEAMFLAELDRLDSRVHAVIREIRDDRNASNGWTVFNPNLQRRIFKGGSPASGASAEPSAGD